MKSEFLKIAGVKSEKAFYKKYPTEAAFFKAHPEAKKQIKKAKIGSYIGGDTLSNPDMIDFNKTYDANDVMITGMNDAMRKAEAEKAAAASSQQSGGGGGMDLGSIIGMFGGEGGGLESIGGPEGMAAMAARHGKRIHKAQAGTQLMANYFNQSQIPDMNSIIQGQTQSPGVNSSMFSAGNQQPSNNPTFAPGSYNSWDIDNNGVPDTIQQVEGNPLIDTTARGVVGEEKTGSKFMDTIGKYAGPLGQVIGGIEALEGERETLRSAKQQRMLSDLTLKASTTRPEQRERKYVRPEDVVNTGEAFFPIYGVGTNVLARNGAKLQDGGMIGGNPTEIQNTYAPEYDIYSDLEYTPLYNVNQQKSFRQGGYLPKAQSGFETFASSGGDQLLGQGISAVTGPNAGGDIGGTIGGTLGTAIGGPIGGFIGRGVGQIAGSLLDKNPSRIKREQAKTKRNLENMAMNQMAPSIQAGYASHMEDGGYVSNNWNPQVITKFGDLDEQDFARFAHKDEFRAGGHLKSYTPPSARAMQTFAMGGELETHWGGYAEPMSYNPYLPGTGETVMFRGKSHEEYSPNGETGIGITYGGNPVEVERGEPMVELQDGGAIDPETGEPQKSGVVFGNLKIPDQYINLLGDPKAKGKKFKNYVADLSKDEEKQNKLIAKSTDELDALDVRSSFDRLKLASLEANIKGGNLKLQDIASKKINAAGLQNAINETAEEYGLVADDLARGKVKKDKEAMEQYAEFGGEYTRLEDGGKTPKFTSEEAARKAGFEKNAQGKWVKVRETKKKTTTEKKSASAMDNIPKQSIDKATGLYGGVTPEQFEAYKKKNAWYPDWGTFDPNDPEDVDKYAKAFNAEAEKRGSKARILPDDKETGKVKFVGKQFTSANIEDVKEETPAADALEIAEVEEPDTKPIPYKRSKLVDFGNQLLEYIRPSDQEPFDYGQTMGEQYALATNQLEPVQAQLFKPEIGIPYDISYQDMLNENQADFNAQVRRTGYNPAAQANLNANKYMANQRVLAEQFRANQAMKDRVYGENRNILNQAKLTNLGILDKQYERQAEAMSNTKATTQAALNSISDKLAKHKLENRTLGVYENLYKYRFDNKGRAINMNPLFQPNIPTVGVADATQKQVPVYGPDGAIQYYQLEKTSDSKKPSLATPGIVSAKKGKTITKNNKNSSIVKAIKNL